MGTTRKKRFPMGWREKDREKCSMGSADRVRFKIGWEEHRRIGKYLPR